ncbi:IS110 family transposase [Photobacterium sanctipauli]|uniref:IS110 family transposase n=2 Tax=Photobacterium sanctipauli TaxID=1342794 RepID=A0A2T3N708_9GAMM|nr:IS110 family transposase [Photobacterium sanctipauli]PSW08455.1 IS110 family transposase [Photobacterium sanctipauli]
MEYVGIDISKAKFDCLWLRDSSKNKVKTKVFKNNRTGFQEVESWLLKNTQSQPDDIFVTLEATGVYHEAVAFYLFDKGFKVSVVNPARPKQFARALGIAHKTDKSDSLLLARFGSQTEPVLWKPEPIEVRELTALIQRVEAIEKDIQREENRKEQADISKSSQLVVESLEKVIGLLVDEKARLIKELDDHIDKHPSLKSDRSLLETIPGVGPVVSRLMLSVLRKKDFESAGSLSAYLGLIPRIRESGTLKGRSTLTKVGPSRIRAKIYMAAVVAKKCNPDIKAQYERLVANGKTHMQALGAAMRKLTQICFGVIKHQIEYQPQSI